MGSAARLRDVIVATGASTDSGVNRQRYGGMDFAAVADFDLARAAVEAAEARGASVQTGVIHSADLFYVPEQSVFETLERMGVLAVEMEAAGLYGLAAENGARALAIVTVSDIIGGEEAMSPDERERSLVEMIEIALDALHRDRG